jgi:hypothetical protein
VVEGGFKTWCPLLVCPFQQFIYLLGCGSFHSIPCIPLFMGCFGFLWLAGCHHFDCCKLR